MSALATVEEHLRAWPKPEAVDDDGNTIMVHTHFLYPSMSVVKVFV